MANTPRSTIQKRIDKIRAEMDEIDSQVGTLIRELEAREFAVNELEAVKKTLPEEEGDESQPEIALRKGSDASKARDALREVRKPLHVDAVLAAIGKEVNKKTRASLAGQLALYARKNQIFEKTNPNEFGLLEWKKAEKDRKAAFLSEGEYTIEVPIDTAEDGDGKEAETVS